MVAFLVVIGIVVLASLIVLSAAVMASRTEDTSSDPTASQSRRLGPKPADRYRRRPTSPAPSNVNLMQVENDEIDDSAR